LVERFVTLQAGPFARTGIAHNPSSKPTIVAMTTT
jgi:hypothetical protein